jgi:AcrR family transcriptional regulator
MSEQAAEPAEQAAEKATRRRGAALEEAILDAAWSVLETSGWGGFTFAAVAERAHSSKPVLYRRWRTREDLLRATLRRRGEVSEYDVPDTGSLRGDTIALLEHVNELRSSMAAVLSMRLSAQFDGLSLSPAEVRREMLGERHGLSLSPAELRREMLGDRVTGMEMVIARAVARGELGPRVPPARVVSLPLDLLRHELLMTLEPVTPQTMAEIVDDVFLPLVRP